MQPMHATDTAYRILIVDDNPSIHEDLSRILCPEQNADPTLDEFDKLDELDELAASILDVEREARTAPLELDSVFRGQDALSAVIRARREQRPYALVFMDMRMPSGWNGMETTLRLVDIDELVHVVVCTGHVDNAFRRQAEPLATNDRVLFLKKPFDPLEVRQLANAMCTKWTLAVRDKRRMQELERMIAEKTQELKATNAHLRQEIAERSRAEQELRKAQRLESLGRMAAGLCHEINNPLAFIAGGIEAMNDSLEDIDTLLPQPVIEDMNDLMHTLSVGADRITQVVRNVRLLARQSDVDTQIVDVHAAMTTAVNMIRPKLDARVTLDVEIDRERPAHIVGRRVELEQVLVNLLDNAFHAVTGPDAGPGQIRMQIRRSPTDDIIIRVVDNGPGIPVDILEQIFDPFFTTKAVNQGTGLGLSICHSLVTNTNGTLQAHDTGDGATFTITLPGVSAELLERAASTSASNMISHEMDETEVARAHLLLVDDEPLILKILKRMLGEHHHIVTVSSVTDGLRLCREQTFDLILSDIMMPDLGGRDFYRLLAKECPGEQHKLVFITGGTMITEVREFLESVPNPCLEKPIDLAVLRALIAERMRS